MKLINFFYFRTTGNGLYNGYLFNQRRQIQPNPTTYDPCGGQHHYNPTSNAGQFVFVPASPSPDSPDATSNPKIVVFSLFIKAHFKD